MTFYQARDFAYEIGSLAGKGKLQELAEEPPKHVIEAGFIKATNENLAAELENLDKVVDAALELVLDSLKSGAPITLPR